jgi:signal transduction histidine kinase
MGELIEDMMKLSRVASGDLNRQTVDLSTIAAVVAAELGRTGNGREVNFGIQPQVMASADPRLIRVLFENLLGNSWKFTSKTEGATIEFGVGANDVYFVRDNGAGFDPQYAQVLFAPFRRLHREDEFPGTGIGLATVHRIIDRHGGRVWAQGEPDHGATVFFTLPLARASARSSGVKGRDGAVPAAIDEPHAAYSSYAAGGQRSKER